MLRINDIIKKYGVSRTTIYNWIKQGLPVVKVGKITFIEEEKLNNFLRKGE